jgi:hypothetical protein
MVNRNDSNDGLWQSRKLRTWNMDWNIEHSVSGGDRHELLRRPEMTDGKKQCANMTYARGRLWLGICGVGSAVSLCTIALALKIPSALLPMNQAWLFVDFASLAGLAGVYLVFMAPFDFMGGYVLPKRFGKSNLPLKSYFWNWLRGASLQCIGYLGATLVLLACGRSFGLLGCVAFVVFACSTLIVGQSVISRFVSGRRSTRVELDFTEIESLLIKWNVVPLPIRVVSNNDIGFTGGVVGLPYFESVLIGDSWLSRLSSQELAAVIARRCVAVSSGARTRGLVIAIGWILIGFVGSTQLPFAGVTSVAEMATTLLGFTLWTFIGLLVLPTTSRQATYVIDELAISQGVSERLLATALTKLDQEQDDEASRTALVETIFHPVPSVTKRMSSSNASRRYAAWHAARMTLFLSWCCAGLLSRAVHCNVGRPELWIMLPTD